MSPDEVHTAALAITEEAVGLFTKVRYDSDLHERGRTTLVAIFPTESRAADYYDRVREPGHWATHVSRIGAEVLFVFTPPADVPGREAFGYALDTVGYCGSDFEGGIATLNGVPAPPQY